MFVLYYAAAAFVGGILGSLMGWANSGEPFVARKFFTSTIRCLFAAGAAATAATIAPPANLTATIVMLIGAFVSGAGFDALSHYTSGAVQYKAKRVSKK